MPDHTESLRALAQRAWELCYLDPLASLALGRQLIEKGQGVLAADGWLHVALAEVRTGDAQSARAALDKARQFYARAGHAEGLAWCVEIDAIALRRGGDYAGSARLQQQVDAQTSVDALPSGPRSDLLQFVAQNSRAITAKLLGHTDDALRHFYAAREAAERTGWAGPRITAISNLGGYHHDLYNLDDARRLSEEGLAAAQEAGSWHSAATAAANLIAVHHAAGEGPQARALVDFLVDNQARLLPGALQRLALFLAMGHLSVGEIDAALAYLEQGAVAAVADGDGLTIWGWLKARCSLAQGDAPAARATAEHTLRHLREHGLAEPPYEMMQLHHVLADACEAVGDAAAALQCMRKVHALYEQLVGRSARARFIALDVGHQLAQAQRERDLAVHSRRSVESDRARLAELNAALQAQIAETEKLHAQLREQALRDPLTGLYNRRYLFESAPTLLELARRKNQPLCVVLIDLDHFKLLNDTYGHHAGDLALQRFATLLQQVLRRSDLVCRHGGEEFVAVMPDTEPETAEPVLNRLLQAFQASTHDTGRRRLPGGSFSAGVALFPRHGSTLEQLLSRADRALYSAKNQGRSRIELAPRTGFGTFA